MAVEQPPDGIELLSDYGTVSELNRLLFHPRGYNLTLGMTTGVITVAHTDDPEGYVYDADAWETLEAKAAAFELLIRPDRFAELGWIEQPLEVEGSGS